jgi:hypothetical protein
MKLFEVEIEKQVVAQLAKKFPALYAYRSLPLALVKPDESSLQPPRLFI